MPLYWPSDVQDEFVLMLFKKAQVQCLIKQPPVVRSLEEYARLENLNLESFSTVNSEV